MTREEVEAKLHYLREAYTDAVKAVAELNGPGASEQFVAAKIMAMLGSIAEFSLEQWDWIATECLAIGAAICAYPNDLAAQKKMLGIPPRKGE